MKVYPEKLNAHLSGDISPVYIISGDDPLLVQETCDELRAGLRKKGFTERLVYHVDATFKWESVLFDANSMSLFAEKKLLELRMPTGKPGDKGAKALRSYAENLQEDNVLLLITDKLDATTQRSKWFSALEKIGVSCQVWPIDIQQLPGWIRKRAVAAGLSMEMETASVLSDKVEGNLLAAVQEIELLRLASSDGKITLEQVFEDVSDSTRYNVFSLLDTALSGDKKRTVLMVKGLRNEGVAILQILGLLARELRTLSSMAHKKTAGSSIDAVMNAQRVWQKRKKIVGYALAHHTANDFEQMIVQAGSIDQMVKGLKPGEPWDHLAALLINLSGAKLGAS